MRRILLVIQLSLLSFISNAQQPELSPGMVPPVNPAPFVIPALRRWTGGSGHFTLTHTSAIVLDPAGADSLLSVATILRDDLEKLNARLRVKIRRGKPVKGDIFLTLQCKDTALGREGYLLNAHDDGLRIAAVHVRGLFWGTRTLLQVLEQDSLHRRFPNGIARDYPKYAIRGFVLDDGRKFFSLNFLRQYVKFMAYYKMNDFHIHLNDNGFRKYFGNNWDSTYSAFRLESSTYPGLTAKDGSYTKQEFRELQELARSYGVNIVPEIDVPAHALAFTKMRPEIGSKKYGMDHLDLDNPVTYQVIDSVFREYLQGPHPVFTGKEVHIGTDEYAKQASEQFRAFTEHYIELVESYGKSVRLWGALTHAQGNTPVKSKGITMNVWYNGYAEPRDMEKLGYDLISSPDGWLYIVPAAGYYYDYLDIRELYNKWEPVQIGDERFKDGDPQIKGGSFAVWNDIVGNGITEKDVHDRVFPAMQVLSQKMWSGSGNGMDFDRFATLAGHIGEGPGANMRAKIKGRDSLVLSYDFNEKRTKDRTLVHAAIVKEGTSMSLRLNGGASYCRTPFSEIGYDYTVSFRIKPDEVNNSNAVLFGSDDAVVKLNQQNTGNLGFSREGYDYSFDYKVPAGQWTSITITGDHIGTSLFVNGVLVQRLNGERIIKSAKDTVTKVQTLFFPLQRIGDPSNAFKGYLDDLKVFNVKLEEEKIRAISSAPSMPSPALHSNKHNPVAGKPTSKE